MQRPSKDSKSLKYVKLILKEKEEEYRIIFQDV
jgi:hypothetical protein